MTATMPPSTPSERASDSATPGERIAHRQSRASRRQERFARRVAMWEERLSSPPPPRKLHRPLILVAMMAAMLWLLWLLTFGPRVG